MLCRVAIADIHIGQRHRKDMGDLKALAESIAADGLLQPVVLTPDYKLIAGARRIEAFKALERQEIPAHIVNIDSIVRGEFVENAVRKDLTVSEKVAIGAALEEALGERQGERTDLQRGDTCPEVVGGRTRDIAGEHAGLGSGKTYERARAVVGAGLRDPDRFGWLVEAMDRTGNVAGAHKRLRIDTKAAAIRAEAPPLPDGRFRVIVADPPWSHDIDRQDTGKLPWSGTRPYPAMPLDDIKGLDVASRAAADCVLWLWTTNPHLPVSFEVIESWGFDYKSTLTWVKNCFGVGHYLRNQSEHCLLALRGKPTLTLTNQTTILQAARREHSRKPDEFYELVEALCPAPPGGYLELFQRTPRPGWVGHGDEATNAGLPSTEAAA